MSPERYQKFKRVLAQRQLDLTVVMENIRKPRNFAAILRNCDAVGIHHAHAITETGFITQHRHTASGANKWVKTHCHKTIEDCIPNLKAQGFQILAAGVTNNCIDFREADYVKPTAIIMGSELFGLSDQANELADQHIIIPMQGLTTSLNVNVATSLVLYEAQRQRSAACKYATPQIPEEEQKKTLFEWSYPEIARHYRLRKQAYPELDEEGYLTIHK